MTKTLVADTGPLIGLARVRHLHLLESLFTEVVVPPEVHRELRIKERRPGSQALEKALEEGWLSVTPLATGSREPAPLTQALDVGEVEAIRLAEERSAILLIDDRRGRAAAKRRGLRIVGTGGVLLAAKKAALLPRVAPVLRALEDSGYRLSPALVGRILQIADESEDPD